MNFHPKASLDAESLTVRGSSGKRFVSALCEVGDADAAQIRVGSAHAEPGSVTGRRDGHQFAKASHPNSEPAMRERELMPEGRARQGTAPKLAGDQPGRAAGAISDHIAVPLSFWLQRQRETFRNQSEKPKEKEEKENE